MPTLKNIVFDLGGVIFEWNPQKILSQHFASPQEQKDLLPFIFEHPDWFEIDRGTLSMEDAKPRIIERTGLAPEIVDDLMQTVMGSLVLIEDSVAFLKEVVSQGYDVYCLSNLSREAHSLLTQKYDFWQHFKGQVISSQIQMVKPEPQIYQYLLSQHNLKAHETLFFDDRTDNIQAAQNCGLHGHVFTDAATARVYLAALISQNN